jgi:hypothetical protein
MSSEKPPFDIHNEIPEETNPFIFARKREFAQSLFNQELERVSKLESLTPQQAQQSAVACTGFLLDMVLMDLKIDELGDNAKPSIKKDIIRHGAERDKIDAAVARCGVGDYELVRSLLLDRAEYMRHGSLYHSSSQEERAYLQQQVDALRAIAINLPEDGGDIFDPPSASWNNPGFNLPRPPRLNIN